MTKPKQFAKGKWRNMYVACVNRWSDGKVISLTPFWATTSATAGGAWSSLIRYEGGSQRSAKRADVIKSHRKNGWHVKRIQMRQP